MSADRKRKRSEETNSVEESTKRRRNDRTDKDLLLHDLKETDCYSNTKLHTFEPRYDLAKDIEAVDTNAELRKCGDVERKLFECLLSDLKMECTGSYDGSHSCCRSKEKICSGWELVDFWHFEIVKKSENSPTFKAMLENYRSTSYSRIACVALYFCWKEYKTFVNRCKERVRHGRVSARPVPIAHTDLLPIAQWMQNVHVTSSVGIAEGGELGEKMNCVKSDVNRFAIHWIAYPLILRRENGYTPDSFLCYEFLQGVLEKVRDFALYSWLLDSLAGRTAYQHLDCPGRVALEVITNPCFLKIRTNEIWLPSVEWIQCKNLLIDVKKVINGEPSQKKLSKQNLEDVLGRCLSSQQYSAILFMDGERQCEPYTFITKSKCIKYFRQNVQSLFILCSDTIINNRLDISSLPSFICNLYFFYK
jgi:hypothetical protein